MTATLGTFGLSSLRYPRPGVFGPTVGASEAAEALMFIKRFQETERFRTILNYFAFYNGQHWSYIRDPSDPMPAYNYVRAFTHKKISGLFRNGFEFQTPDGDDQTPTLQIINEVWDYNKRLQLAIRIGVMGMVSGDAFIKVTYDPDLDRVVLVLLDTATCFPIFDPHLPGMFQAFKIEYVGYDGADGNRNEVRLFTEIYHVDGTVEYAVDGRTVAIFNNPFGFISIVHIKNELAPRSDYGISDYVDLIPLQKAYNEASMKLQDTVNYHAEPITLIYGARMNQLVKGARKTISGLPKDARVENLRLDDNLQTLQEYRSGIKESMHEIGEVPVSMLGREQAISNTSNAALQTQYLPFVDGLERKHINYGTGFEQLNYYIARIYKDWVKNTKIPRRQINPEDRIINNWPSPLPKDIERVISQQLVPLATLNMLDREEALKDIGVRDPKKYLKKIDDDRVADAHVQAEIQEILGQVEVDQQKQLAKFQQQPNPDSQTDEKKEGQDRNQKIAG